MIPNRMTVTPFHVWKSLLDKAGYKPADIPKTWDAFLDFFPPVAAEIAGAGHAQHLCLLDYDQCGRVRCDRHTSTIS